MHRLARGIPLALVSAVVFAACAPAGSPDPHADLIPDSESIIAGGDAVLDAASSAVDDALLETSAGVRNELTHSEWCVIEPEFLIGERYIGTRGGWFSLPVDEVVGLAQQAVIDNGGSEFAEVSVLYSDAAVESTLQDGSSVVIEFEPRDDAWVLDPEYASFMRVTVTTECLYLGPPPTPVEAD